MSRTALITGASTGIGYELSRQFAADHHDLILIARDERRLNTAAGKLTREYGVSVSVIAADLSRPETPEEIHRRVPEADYLVNNAGFGLGGFFSQTDLAAELSMIQVNVTALVQLCKLYLKGMLDRRSGGILNVASTAAFQPGPIMSIYYASKAFVLSFTEAIANETKGTGVTVTALCPGPTESEFHKRARTENTRLMKKNPIGLMTAEEVARMGYEGFKSGKAIVIPGLMNKIGVQAVRISPRALVRQITRKLQET